MFKRIKDKSKDLADLLASRFQFNIGDKYYQEGNKVTWRISYHNGVFAVNFRRADDKKLNIANDIERTLIKESLKSYLTTAAQESESAFPMHQETTGATFDFTQVDGVVNIDVQILGAELIANYSGEIQDYSDIAINGVLQINQMLLELCQEGIFPAFKITGNLEIPLSIAYNEYGLLARMKDLFGNAMLLDVGDMHAIEYDWNYPHAN